jgi:hypothetical protein
MIDLEEIDLYAAAPGTTSARKIRAGKKNVAKILANARSIPSWKLSLASLRGKKTRLRLAPRFEPIKAAQNDAMRQRRRFPVAAAACHGIGQLGAV